MARTRTLSFALCSGAAGLFCLLMASALVIGCSSSRSTDPTGRVEPTGVQTESVTGPVTITLSAPNPLSAIAPVMEATNSISLGANANVVSGTTAVTGSGGMPDVEPGALVNDVWSRGPVVLRDRVVVRGVLHAATVTTGNGDTCSGGSCTSGAGRDSAPRLDPVSSLSWTVSYPGGTGANVTLGFNQSQVLPPGLYGSITLNSASTLTLSSGTYFTTDFIVNSGVSVILNQANGPIIIYATNQLNLRGAFVPAGGADGGTSHPDLMIGYLGTTNQVFVESLFDGAIVVPFTTLTLRQVSGIHTGFFAAKNINNLDSSVRVQYRFPAAVVGAANPPGPACEKLLHGVVPESLIPHYCHKCRSPDDTDHDGVPDCLDGCPYDHDKTAAGLCGCGISDQDSDGDGVPDCLEPECASDPNNVTPGQCGCVGGPFLKPVGTRCSDTACPQSGATCNGAGVCGNRAACNPCASGGVLVNRKGTSYWLCGVPLPAETGPDGGPENKGNTTGQTTESGAQAACTAKGLTLTRIGSRADNRFIAQFLTQPIWLGANDIAQSGAWRWSAPGTNSGDQFWSGGPTGSPVNNLFSFWGPGAPGTQTCSSMQPGDGRWFDTGCSESLGYSCQFATPVVQLTDAGGPPGMPDQPPALRSADGGVAACVPEFGVDAGGLPDTQAELLADLDAASQHVFIGAAANPPPDGSVCPSDPAINAQGLGFGPDSGSGCWFSSKQKIPGLAADGGPGDCFTNSDCVQALGAGFVCREIKDDPTCQPPAASDASLSIDAGSCHGTAWCVQLQCPPVPAQPCNEIQICKTGTDFDASLDPTSNLDAGSFNPASMFGGTLPDAAPVGAYIDPPNGSGPNHTWCFMNPQHAVPAANEPPTQTNGSSGRGSSIQFAFDPNLTFDVNANPLALGESAFKVHAAATLKASVSLSNFLGQNYSADIVDVGIGIQTQRCSVNNDETQFVVLGLDVISLAGLGIPQFDSTNDFPTQTASCNDAVGNFLLWANRAKKAFRDAQQLLSAYKDITGAGNKLAPSLCNDILSAVGASDINLFPGGLNCPEGQTVEETINRFVDYLQAPGFGQITQLRRATGNLADKSSQFLKNVILKEVGKQTFRDFPQEEDQTILNVPFAIGPIPMLLQVDVFAGYGVSGGLDLDINFPFRQLMGLDDTANVANPNDGTPGTPVNIAHVEADVMPYASAGLSAFVGAGVDLGPFNASLGIEGAVTLGQLEAPIYAGAELDLLLQYDPRPIPADIAKVSVADIGNASNPVGSLFHFNLPKSFSFAAGYYYGAGLQLDNILSGEIDVRLRISFFFFSRTWRSRLVHFNGWSAHVDLIKGGSGPSVAQQAGRTLSNAKGQAASTTEVTGQATMGLGEMQLPLTVLSSISVVPDAPEAGAPDGGDAGDAGTPQIIPFDASAVQGFFYDELCCVKGGESCSASGTPHCCPDFTCTDAGVCAAVCIGDGGTCRSGARIGCCGGQFCGPENTCASCVKFAQGCNVAEPCCSGMVCSAGTCCMDLGQSCGTNSECCSNFCSGSICQTPIQ